MHLSKKKSKEEKKFDSFLTKVIILSSKQYFRNQMNNINKEKTIMDNENYCNFVQGFTELNNPILDFEKAELRLELQIALKSLSDIEKSVISLLFYDNLTQDEAAQMLEIYSKSISRIKMRAIEKLKNDMLKGD